MRKRLIIIGFVCFLAICASYVWLSFNPILIHKPYSQNAFGTSFDNSYNPIDSIDFIHGKTRSLFISIGKIFNFYLQK